MKPEVRSPKSGATRLKGARHARLCLLSLSAGLLAGSVPSAAPAPREVINRAEVRFMTAPGISNFFTSLPVVTLVPAPLLTDIAFFNDTSFSVRAICGRIGRDLYIQAHADGCNRDSNAVETCTIILTSTKTGDRETLVATETAANSGIFRVIPYVPTRNAAVDPVQQNDGSMETTWNDRLIAETDGCGSTRVTAELIMDPGGVVFESRADQPIPGARVSLINAITGSPAQVFDSDGQTPVPSTMVTGADGRYHFPSVAAGTYRLAVVPPQGYSSPSAVPVSQLPTSRLILVPGSFGGNFTNTGMIDLDVPVDAITTQPGGLFIQKLGSRQAAEPGDFVDYSLEIKNLTSNALAAVTVWDSLPRGFAYVSGSSRFERNRIADPAGRAGPRLEYVVGPIPANQVVSLSYRVRIGPGAGQGDGINKAQAVNDSPRIVSNIAQYRLHVGGGVFTDRGVVFGKVFVDANRNHVQDSNEPGVPGIRLYLEDGTYAITDSEGKYSIYGVRPLTHIVKVDPATVPAGGKLIPLSNRHADNGGSKMVELRRGEFHKADFALASLPLRAMEEVKQRRASAERNAAEGNALLKNQLTPDGAMLSRGDPKGLAASGAIGTGISGGPSADKLTPIVPERTNPSTASKNNWKGTNAPLFEALLPDDTLNSENSPLAPAPVGDARPPRYEPGITNLDNTLGFVDLGDGDTLPIAQACVRVKTRQGTKIALFVNDAEIAASRAGRRVSVAEKQLEITEFVGVPFKPGTNRVTVRQLDGFGNLRDSNSITVIAPDKLAKLQIILGKKEASADGKTVVPVRIELRDGQGVPVTSRTPLTLEASLGEWQTKDLDPAEPGTQVFVKGGNAEFGLLAPLEPGDCRIRAGNGTLKAEAIIPFLPDLRPLIAAGILEGRMSLNHLKRGSIVPARSQDGFEEELRSFAISGEEGRFNSGGRAAFFLKGKIKGEYLLTAGFDSEKETGERLFRDIQPDEFYPVYGDSATRGFDAQSTSRLYVRVDKKKCYLLYGDYLTASQSEARALGNYSRSLTGIREHYENNRVSANLWASYDSSSQVIEELPANGTSGPYRFRTANAIVNSEKVEIITRDRNQPSLILKTVPMSRFADYEFEPFTGRILFRAPVPSLDPNLNPISIRVTYEVDKGGDKFWVYGADAQAKLTPWLELGGAAARDENPLGNYGLYSGNTTLKLAPKTFLIGEVAQSVTEETDGFAGRVELRHQDAKTDARIYYGRAESTFSNTASLLSAGRMEAGGKASYRISSNTRLVGQALVSEAINTDAARKGVRVDIERTFPNQLRLEVGARYSTETDRPASPSTRGVTPNEVTSLRTKLTTPIPKVKGASLYGEYENDVIEPEKRLVAVGGDYQLRPKTRLYARHEFINAIGGPFELNTVQQRNITLIGLDTEYMKDGTLFNEYRMKDAMAGRDAEAATGLRNLWHLAEGVRLNTTFERISPVSGADDNEATSATAALEYTRQPDWKATARLELRTSEPNDSLLNTLGYARKLSRDWTFLSRSIIYAVNAKAAGAGDKTQARFQAGLAWRQTEVNRLNALVKYEYKFEDDATVPTLQLYRHVHMLLCDLNFQATADLSFSGHYGGKLAFEESNGHDDRSDTHLFAVRATYDLNPRWDIAICGRVLFSGGNLSTQFGVGPEIGYKMRDSLRLAGGYNLLGFRDRDLSREEYTDHGVYVALRWMFDESLLGLRKEGKQ
jgi:uncharacterized repeat protein (TIGR01451 family)